MNINLNDLGISAEKIQSAVVEEIADRLLNGDNEWSDSKLHSQLKVSVDKAVKERLDRFVADILADNISVQIESLKFTQTNRYGEKISETLTLREWVTKQITEYFDAEVDAEGNTRQEKQYNFQPAGKRALVLFKNTMRQEIQVSLNQIWREGNKPLLDAVQEAVMTQLDYLRENLRLICTTEKKVK